MILTYVVGDVHGQLGLLDRLLALVERHRAGAPRRLVTLGDYVDRGPDSAGVVARLRALRSREPGAVVCLAGNHEDMMLRAGEDEAALAHWLGNGGRETLASYGAGGVADLPADDLAWLAGLPTLHADGLRLYVHAGLRPGLAPEETPPEDRLWLREPFLGVEHDFGRHVVHGHTPQASGLPDLRPYRTNLDTGAAFGGPLSAGVFDEAGGGPFAVLQVDPDGGEREVRLAPP